MAQHSYEHLEPIDVILDALPEHVVASTEQRDRWLAALNAHADGHEYLLNELLRWNPVRPLRVAFLGGNANVQHDIATTVAEIEEVCSIRFDFGLNVTTGEYRSWSTKDAEYAAEIRVSFDKVGYFSLVGTDSNDPNVGAWHGSVGGRPYQTSLNLGGFHIKRPDSWRGTVLHEFLHALGILHEHVNTRGPCQDDFRWDDDPDYLPTKDTRGRYVRDQAGRRPGIYTYLSGYPNHWSKSKIDHNLRPGDAPVTAGTFDRESVMLYRFASLFYRQGTSDCKPIGDGQRLSAGDIAGLQRLYPLQPSASANARAADMLRAVRAFESAGPIDGPESDATRISLEGARALEQLGARVEAANQG